MFNEIPRDILKGWKVLVVDDDPKSLDIAASLLAFYGATVDCAKNGQEGIDLAHKLRPDFMISDLSMPTLDGWDLIRQLKKIEPRWKFPLSLSQPIPCPISAQRQSRWVATIFSPN